MKHSFGIIRIIAFLLTVCVGCWIGYSQITPIGTPAGFTEKTTTLAEAGDQPDLDLMLTNLKAMSSEVHSVDTPGMAITQAYVKAQLDAMGYPWVSEEYQLTMDEILELEQARCDFRNKPLRSDEASIRDYSGIGDKPTMNLSNIVVTIDAPNTDETVILVAHIDSVKFGPGTFDDTVSCAGLLEALRMLKGVTPVRDMVFLFADGEEQGMLGSAKFVEDHPELKDRTKLVANFEARGNTGALLMFETTGNNLGLVRMYDKAVTTPVSFSIATSVYTMMSNDTDLTRFMMAGYPGINFSVIEGAEVYHTAEDNYEGFNRDSAAHYMETIVSYAKYVATEQIGDVSASEDGVFFPLFKGNLVIMSETMANVLAWLSLALTVLLTVVLLMKKKASGKTMLKAFLCQLAALIVSGGVGFGIVKVLANANGLVKANDFLRFAPAPYVFFGLLIVAVVVVSLLFNRMAGRAEKPVSVALGVLPLLAIVAVVTTFVFPSASYMFAWTALILVVVTAVSCLCSKAGLVLAVLGGILSLMLFAPIVYLVYVALNMSTCYAAVLLAMFPLTALLGMFAANKR